MAAPDETDPTIAPPISKEKADLFSAIGIAIVAWQEVEVSLFAIYGRFLRGADQSFVSAAFHSTVNFNIKLDATHAAACFALKTTPLMGVWETMYGRLNKKVRLRNKIAHYHMYCDPLAKKPEKIWFLGPNWADPRSNLLFGVKQHSDKLHTKEVRDAIEAFDGLRHDMDFFYEKLPPLPKQKKSFQQLLYDWTKSRVEANPTHLAHSAPPAPFQASQTKPKRPPKLSAAQKRAAREKEGDGEPG